MNTKKKRYNELSENSCDDGEHCAPQLEGRVMVLESKMDISFAQLNSIDKKIWFIVTGLILVILMQIMFGIWFK